MKILENLAVYQYLKNFKMKSVVILNKVIVWHCITKCVNIWKIYTTQWINIFQMTSAWYKYKIDQWILK